MRSRIKKYSALVTLGFFLQFCWQHMPVLAGEMHNLRGKRYGEVILGQGGVLVPKQVDVYNTIGLNECPQELWSKLSVDSIKKQTGARVVKLNGPRYWVIDGMTGSELISTEKRNFGGIDMRLAGILELSMSDLLKRSPYVLHKVNRKTTWVFQAGQPVYQLISPENDIYFMQSYSVQKIQQDMESLAKLQDKLHLPKDWQFRCLNLDKDFYLTAENGVAYIVQDEFDNTYQKSSAKNRQKE